MVTRISLAVAALLSISPFTQAEEQQFRCAHCAIMASQYAAAAANPGEAPKRKYAPDRVIDVLHLKLEITPDFETQELEGRVTLDFSPIAKPLRQLHLDAGDLHIAKIESSHAVTAHQLTVDGLEITFSEEIAAGVKAQVVIEYDVSPKKGLYVRSAAMGYAKEDEQLWTQGEPQDHQHWYPSHDYPNEKFTTEMVCHVPTGMIVLSNGHLVSESADAATGLTTFHWLQDKVHVNYLVSLVAGYFEKLEDMHGDLPIALYVPPSKKAVAHNTFRDTKKILAFFEEEIGVQYPWDKYYNVCAIDYMMGGMENTSLTTLTLNTLFPDEMENLQSSRGLDAHEAAHQWFGDLVTCRDWSHIWLNEGFATYYSLLYDRHAVGEDFFKYGLYRNAQGIFRNDKDTIPIVYQGYGDPMEQFSFRAYPKGGWVLHMLRGELGEDLFRQCVKTYLERHAYETVVTQDLVEVFEELSGRSLSQFFDQWVYLSGYPSLKVDYKWDELAKLAKLTVSQTQMKSEKRALFDFPLPVRFKVGDKVHEESITISKEREDFYIALDAAPSIVRLDPDLSVLVKIEFKPAEALLIEQLGDTSDVVGRIEAVKQLAEKKNDVAVEKLGEALNKDAFFAVRQAAAEGLGSIRDAKAFDVLQRSLDQGDARVRQSVVQAIRKYYSDDAYNVLKTLVDQESNPGIRTTAIRELGNYAKPELRYDLLDLLQSESYGHAIARAAIDAMGAQDDPFYVEPLRRALESDEANFTSSGFSNALIVLGRLARNEESKTEVCVFLMRQVDHLKRNVARSAMRALGELHDSKAKPLLDSYVAADSESEDGRAAKQALDILRKEVRAPVPEAVNRLGGQVNDLEAQLKRVNEDLKSLRAQFKEALKVH
jgi:aminopeptidase N